MFLGLVFLKKNHKSKNAVGINILSYCILLEIRVEMPCYIIQLFAIWGQNCHSSNPTFLYIINWFKQWSNTLPNVIDQKKKKKLLRPQMNQIWCITWTLAFVQGKCSNRFMRMSCSFTFWSYSILKNKKPMHWFILKVKMLIIKLIQRIFNSSPSSGHWYCQ